MTYRTLAFAAMAAVSVSNASAAHQTEDDPLTRPIAPQSAQRWLGPQAPSRVHGNTYSVGFAGLTVGLIATGEGLILIDGAVPQAVRDVEANIRRLGFRVEDIRYILSTEPHYDHAGGLAALSRDSGATVLAGAAAARVLRTGQADPEDPQHAQLPAMPAVTRLRAVADGETIRLGNVTVTARATPGHTTGSTSWSWRSCAGDDCRDMVFAASLNPISADGWRFADHPDAVAAFRRGFAALRVLPCTMLITSHPGMGGEGAQPCRAYADAFETRLETRLAQEAGAAQAR